MPEWSKVFEEVRRELDANPITFPNTAAMVEALIDGADDVQRDFCERMPTRMRADLVQLGKRVVAAIEYVDGMVTR
jgi:hypothetical protein